MNLPSNTFLKLNDSKRLRIERALLKEFSNHPLDQSQVARIIEEAEISRGAFYKYFDDLTDAYQYLLNQKLAKLHAHLENRHYQHPNELIQAMKNFINEVQASSSYALFKMHFKYNENLLRPFISTTKMSTPVWTAFVLSHETLRSIFLDPDNQVLYFERFKTAILNLRKEQ